jgi:hypothetical protein
LTDTIAHAIVFAMTDTTATVERLLEKSNELKHGPQRISVLEEAVKIADEEGDLDAAFGARMNLMDAATMGGRPDLLLSAFTWCLAEHDRDPDRFDLKELLWKYKWVVCNVVEFPHISRAQIESMLADMARRFEEAGSTLHGVHQARREILADMGDFAGADEATARLAATKRDWLSDCRACVCDVNAGQHAAQERDADALADAAPILAGRMKCSEVPHRTYSQLLLPLVRLGRLEEAREYHEIGFDLIGENPEFVAAAASHLEFLAMTGELDDGLEALQSHLPNALSTPSDLNRLRFYGAAWLLMVMLAEDGQRTLRLKLPASFALFDANGVYETASLQEWLRKEIKKLAAQFDARNGNEYYTRWAARRWRC